MSNLNNGHRERRLKGEFRAVCQATSAPCHRCRQPIDYTKPANHPESFDADHYHPVKTHPHLAYELSNLRPSHCKCNRSAKAADPTPGQWVEANW